jgi:hypothetical protein
MPEFVSMIFFDIDSSPRNGDVPIEFPCPKAQTFSLCFWSRLPEYENTVGLYFVGPHLINDLARLPPSLIPLLLSLCQGRVRDTPQ